MSLQKNLITFRQHCIRYVSIPLAFCINPGNQNEQLPLKPLEQQIMKDFELSNHQYSYMLSQHLMLKAISNSQYYSLQ